MTDDEILLMAAQVIRQQCVSEMTNQDWIACARAIESRTLTNQKARWYQTGVEAERHDIAKMVENYCGAWDDKGQALVQMIKSREK